MGERERVIELEDHKQKVFERKAENFVAGLRISGLSYNEIRDLLEDAVDIVQGEETDAENLGRYS